MSAVNRTALLTKIHRSLKKHYKAGVANLKMPLLEQLLFACVLEDAPPAAAEKAFAALDEHYFDWNEVRVSTVTELAETLSMLPEPQAAASRVKRVLQSVFEATYSFDLESLKKGNIGAAQKRLTRFDGVSPFSAAYVTQTALGGHAIPLSRGSLETLYILGAITEKEKATSTAQGLERAIPKNKGIEFGSLLNQLGVDYLRNPFSPAVRKFLLSIAPDAKDRFPKRGVKTPEPQLPAAAEQDGKSTAKQTAAKKGPEPPSKQKNVQPAKAKSKDQKAGAAKKPVAQPKKPAAGPKKTPPRKPVASRATPRKPR